MPRSTLVLAPLALLLGAGCALELDTGLPRGDAVELHVDRYVWGLVGGDLPVEPVGIVRVQEGLELTDLLFTALTLGLYCPTSATVWLERPGPGFERVERPRPRTSSQGFDEGDDVALTSNAASDRDERSSWFGRARSRDQGAGDPPVSSGPWGDRGARARSGR